MSDGAAPETKKTRRTVRAYRASHGAVRGEPRHGAIEYVIGVRIALRRNRRRVPAYVNTNVEMTK